MRSRCLSLLSLMLVCVAVYASDPLPPGIKRELSQYPEPGLSFGPSNDFPLPKTLLYDASPDEIIADAAEWKKRGIDGFFMSGCMSGWSCDIWGVDGKPWTIGQSDDTLQKAKRATEVCSQLGMETIALMTFSQPFDWFDDIAWQHITHNFRQFALFAREAGCTGVVMDMEYIMDQYAFEWSGYDYSKYTEEDVVRMIRLRTTGVARAMYDEFPNMVFVCMPELEFRLGSHIQLAWIEEAARRNAPGGVHYCVGYTYRNHNLRYMLGRGWLDNMFVQRMLSMRGRQYWEKKCSLSPGIWPFGFPEYFGHGPELTPEEFRHAVAGSQMMARRYTWVFTGGCKPQLLERNMDAYKRKEDIKDYIRVLAAREIVTTPKYAALAREIRDLKLRDYSADLGLVIEPVILGPYDYGMLNLVPKTSFSPNQQEDFWKVAIERINGRIKGLKDRVGTCTHWMLIGPFPNEGLEFKGHNTAYPPEAAIDLSAEYDGIGGKKVRWEEHAQNDTFTAVNLAKAFTPTEHVCAYALCYVTVPKETTAQIRLGTNDSGKLWIGGKLVFDYPNEGGMILDRNVVPVTLPSGTTPILLKVCNGEGLWGFVFRITDEKGRPLANIGYSLAPPK